jgi:endonuclease YncB( thermonuclease family)
MARAGRDRTSLNGLHFVPSVWPSECISSSDATPFPVRGYRPTSGHRARLCRCSGIVYGPRHQHRGRRHHRRVREDVPKRDPIRIRLYGIDTPERRQPFSAKAAQFTSEAVFEKTVTVQPRGKHFERLIADVVLPDGKLLNHEIVRAGLAWWYEKYAPYDRDLQRLQEEAREAKRGFWSDGEAVPPWEWRRR